MKSSCQTLLYAALIQSLYEVLFPLPELAFKTPSVVLPRVRRYNKIPAPPNKRRADALRPGEEKTTQPYCNALQPKSFQTSWDCRSVLSELSKTYTGNAQDMPRGFKQTTVFKPTERQSPRAANTSYTGKT
jgi:hypothetical protein